MRRLRIGSAIAFIVLYLGLHAGFFLGHMLDLTSARGLSYFFTWDMYGGHSPWETRVHVVAEGHQGALYRVLPGPWAPFQPHGDAFRHDRDWHWDWRQGNLKNTAESILERTDHEPIAAVYVVEERWLSKYNLPDDLWSRHYGVEKPQGRYFRVREVFAPNTDQRQTYPGLESELLAATPLPLTAEDAYKVQRR